MAQNLTQLRMPRFSGGPMSPAQAAQDAVVRQTVPYYSRGRFHATKIPDTVNTYTYTQGAELRCFGYGIGDPMTPAVTSTGVSAFATGATFAETNLEKKSSTNNGEMFRIFGVGFFISPISDFWLASYVLEECSLQLQFGTQQGQLIGKPFHLPGGGGLQGSGKQNITALNATLPFASNGWQEFKNVAVFPEGILWNPEGRVDSQLIVNVKLNRTVTVTGVAASPADGIVDFEVRLYGEGQRPRSSNQ